jgi:hypothetical protein
MMKKIQLHSLELERTLIYLIDELWMDLGVLKKKNEGRAQRAPNQILKSKSGLRNVHMT